MAGSVSLPPLFLPLLLILLYAALPAHAFGAGNIASISKIEGANWRHGDIEDTLLQLLMASSLGGKKFDSMTVKRIYFGNWLRDYSQAIDVGSVKYVEAPTIRLILWILAFMTFGYGTGEFEVTEARLGCYRPEEHIDNPKDYADNFDARSYDNRLRGPVDEEIELAIDPQTGMKNYIANEHIRQLRSGEPMHTSAGLVRNLFTRSIDLGRSYARSGNKAELYEALRLMGTGLHCLEDFSAHSNYTELALIEMGETMVFPHVGSSTGVNIRGKQIFPLVTGTFGGVDFLHSVLGEFSDKATQSEIEQLEGAVDQASQANQSGGGAHSIIRDLLNKFHIGGAAELDSQATDLENKSKAKAAEGQQGQAWGIGASGEEIRAQIYPFLEWHDKIMLAINKALESIPGLTAIVEKLSEAVSVFVFSLIAPFIMPIIQQVKVELSTGSSEVIGSSKNLQFIVFTDNYSSNPTHSMLSKDHFTNCLNEPAGKVASEVIKIVVPTLMAAWDNPHADVEHTLNEIVGLFHHPAFIDGSDGRGGVQGRHRMFNVVRQWWQEKDENEREFLRHSLSREGVQAGRNHKEGQHDTGHGCGKPIHRVKPKENGGEFGVGGDMGKTMGNALEQAFTGGQGGGSSSGFGGLLGGIAGAAFTGYVSNQMGGEEGRSSGFEEIKERGGGLERGIQRSYEQSGNGPGKYEETSYERPTHHGDTAEYLRTDSYGAGEGRSYYGGGVEETESYSAPGYERNESYNTSGYGRTDSFNSIPGGFEERGSHREGGYAQSGYAQGGHSGSGALYRSEHGHGANTSGHGSEAREVSYTSQVSHESASHGGYTSQVSHESALHGGYTSQVSHESASHGGYTSQVSHESASHGGYTSYEARVEHHGHGHDHHRHGHGHGGIVEGGYERREKVYQEYSGDERGGGYYTESHYKKHNSGEEESEYRRYRRSGSGDEVEIEYRRGPDEEEEEEEEDEYERKKREKKERKRLEREYRRRGSGSGSDNGEECYGSGDERPRYEYD